MFTSLRDKTATAQVDETHARVLLKEKRFGDAEKVAPSSVPTLEKSDIAARRISLNGIVRLKAEDVIRLFRAA